MRNTLRMTLEKAEHVETGFEDDAPTKWVTVCEVEMQLRPLRGKELIQAQQLDSLVTHVARCPFFQGVDSSMRLSYQNRRFNIQSVFNEDERNRFLVWQLIEVFGGS